MQFTAVEDAKKMRGLRLVLAKGIWAAWSECAKSIFAYKKVPYAAVAQYTFEENAELVAWTGVRNQPQAVFDDEPVRTGWLDILNLAERLAPEPALLPGDAQERALAVGLSNELCGEWGLAWCGRVLVAGARPLEGAAKTILEQNYGLARATRAAAETRCIDIVTMFGARLRTQEKKGSRYFVGDRMTAADIYWACMSNLIHALPHEICPMGEGLRTQVEALDPRIRAAFDPRLLAHRDHIYRAHLPPVDFL